MRKARRAILPSWFLFWFVLDCVLMLTVRDPFAIIGYLVGFGLAIVFSAVAWLSDHYEDKPYEQTSKAKLHNRIEWAFYAVLCVISIVTLALFLQAVSLQ